MSHTEEEDPKPKENWTENDLKEAIRRINAGEINFKEAENVYGISPRTIHRQRAIGIMRMLPIMLLNHSIEYSSSITALQKT